MNISAPTPKQARIFWSSLTALSVAVLIAIIVLLLWCVGWVLERLSSVLLPLAMAGILAYLLDPLVDFLQRRKLSRPVAIFTVFLLGIFLVLSLLATVMPRLIVEAGELIQNLPHYAENLVKSVSGWLEKTPLGLKSQQAWDSQFGSTVQAWMAKALPAISTWILSQMSRVVSWFGLIIGFALVPVYVFYLLLEKRGITQHWTDYLPIRESRTKEEVVFVLKSINDCLVIFFRGQVLVAICDGVLITLGLVILGLNYSFLLGLMTGLLSVVPYLGVAVSLVPCLIIAIVQFNDWLHPLLVLGVFTLVFKLDGLFISPKIMGERVGLHPLTIIVAVMIGTTLLGGILGGVLAIPLTAAMRVLMFRYVWKRPAGTISHWTRRSYLEPVGIVNDET